MRVLARADRSIVFGRTHNLVDSRILVSEKATVESVLLSAGEVQRVLFKTSWKCQLACATKDGYRNHGRMSSGDQGSGASSFPSFLHEGTSAERS